ncbi:hypothetical protein V5O48_011973 [Marasmius crinis-equi]|uniref:DNA (cytosine-5-)-methyltransferase n=1 Tax=Marasmius crinis-equi TaxID=585013 RepID=A0ABR3F419_9AGAR
MVSGKRRRPATPRNLWTPLAESFEREGEDLVLAGETAEDDDERDFEEGQLTVRKLRDFAFFDARDNVMVPLDIIERDCTKPVEAAGFVSPCFEGDEDEEVEVEEPDLKRYVALGAIERFWLDYTVENGAIWIETYYSWYILEDPSTAYTEIYNHFLKPHRIAQFALSSALQNPNEDYEVFVQRLRSRNGWKESDLWASSSIIRDALETEAYGVMSSVLLRLFPNTSEEPFSHKPSSSPRFRHRVRKDVLCSTDSDARKHVTATTVTPLVATLAEGLVPEVLQVIGRKPSSKCRPNRFQQDELPKLLANARDMSRIVSLDGDGVDGFYSQVTVGREKFKVGDVILIPRYPNDERPVEPHHIFADHFWFAKLMHFRVDGSKGKIAHIQWLNHGSHIDIGEIAHPYELFIDQTCTDLEPLTKLAGRVVVKSIPGIEEIPNNKFFVRYCTQSFSTGTATSSPCMTSLNHEALELAATLSLIPPPDNCPVCVHKGQRQSESSVAKAIASGRGFAYQGESYHLYDFVLYASGSGPANIGQIVKIYPDSSATVYKIKLVQLGRIREVVGVPSECVIDSERHLFITSNTKRIRPADIVRPCYMFPHRLLREGYLEDWLHLSPYHFFFKHSFPTPNRPSWSNRCPLPKPVSCKECVDKSVRTFGEHRDFVATRKGNKQSTLDLFGGCGALGLGFAEGSEALEVTHAIEILPSSAKTYQRNSPHTKVYNQCVNTILRYAIKEHSGHSPKPPEQLFDKTTAVPPPPKPGDVDVVVAGFPWFKQAGNVKSNLILNALSWIDFLKPKFCLFENVPAFKDEKLNVPYAQRNGIHGEIQGGYFKLLLRALLDMGYQVRHGILQAGEFGTPQSRSRFFLIAAKRDLELPEFPTPTHLFPANTSTSVASRLPHHPVTINDAIDDLPPFDWKDPDDADNREYDDRDGRHFPIFESTGARCGFEGVVAYAHPTPRTRFQKQARRNPATDLQHFTKVLKREHIRRQAFDTAL